MGDDRVDRYTQVVGNLLVGHTLHQRDNHVLLAIRECLGVLTRSSLEHHIGDIASHIILLGQLLQTTDGRHKDIILYHRMLAQPHLVLIDIVERGRQLVVVLSVLRQILDDEQLQLAQFLVGSTMMLRESLHIIVIGRTPLYQRLHIGEERLLLVFHVTAYLVGILVVEAKNEFCQRVALVERFLQLATDIGQLEVQEIGVTGLQIVKQGGDGQLLVGLKLAIPIDGEVDHSQEGIGIHPVALAGFLNCLITKTKTDAETAQHLQEVVVIANQRNHLVVGLIHLLILHCPSIFFTY